MQQRKKAFVITTVIVLLTIGLLVASIPSAKAQFVLASWDYPDEYGQGIPYISVRNSTEWVETFEYFEEATLEVAVDANVTLAVFVWLNGTLVGISSSEEGKSIIRHSVVVSSPSNSSVFSQQNFTFMLDTGESNAPMYFYRYDIILDFPLIAGTIYTAVITYEIFY